MALIAISEGLRALSDVNKAIESYQNARFVKEQADIHARYLEILASNAERRGDIQAKNLEKQGKKFLGTQRASVVSQGIAADSETVQNIEDETRALLSEDAQEIRNATWQQVFGYQLGAERARSQGAILREQYRREGDRRLLKAGARAISGYQRQSSYNQRLKSGSDGGSWATTLSQYGLQ